MGLFKGESSLLVEDNGLSIDRVGVADLKGNDFDPECMDTPQPLGVDQGAHFDDEIDVVGDLPGLHDGDVDRIEAHGSRKRILLACADQEDLLHERALPKEHDQEGDVLVDAVVPDRGVLLGKDGDSDSELLDGNGHGLCK